MIYKIFRNAEWTELSENRVTAGAPIDVQDGYIHFSTAQQAAETAAKHFAGTGDLWLAALDETKLGDKLIWEKSRNDDLFPHLYRRLGMEDIIWCRPLPLVEGSHVFPDDLA